MSWWRKLFGESREAQKPGRYTSRKPQEQREPDKEMRISSTRKRQIIIGRELADRFAVINITVRETARAHPATKRMAWADLDERGDGVLFLDRRSFPIVGGLEGTGICFSENGHRFGYVTNNPTPTVSIIEGQALHIDADYVTNLNFSPDGTMVSFIAWRTDPATLNVTVGTNTYGPFTGVDTRAETPVVFSQTENHFGFLAYRSNEALAVIDGKEIGPYDGVSGFRHAPELSDDGSRYFFHAQVGDRWTAIDNGRQGEMFDGIIAGNHCLSANGRRAAYGCGRGTERYLVVDGAIVETFRDGSWPIPVPSPDGSQIAVIVKGEKLTRILLDGAALAEHDSPEEVIASSLVWSPDSKRIAYLASTKDNDFVIVDGQREGPIGRLGKPGIVFSPDSAHYAYFARREGSLNYLVLDGVPSEAIFSEPIRVLAFLDGGAVRFADVAYLERKTLWIEASLCDAPSNNSSASSTPNGNISLFLEQLGDADWKVGLQAAEALVSIGDSAVEPLIQVLESSSRPFQARASAAYALGKIGDKRAVKPLTRIVTEYCSGTENSKRAGKLRGLTDREWIGLFRAVRQALESMGYQIKPR